MKRTSLLFIGLALVVLLGLASCGPPPPGVRPAPPPNPLPQQGGMMGPQGTPGPYQQPYPPTSGGMMGSGMMGGMMGGGMMGGSGSYSPQARPLTPEGAAAAVRRYINAYGGNLALKEVMEFAWNFYAEVEEQDSGIHAMELLINKKTGQVYPEMGPNMMWNTKYGMMAQMMGSYYAGGVPSAKMPVTPEQAKTLAQRFLDGYLPGLTVADADTFYGYYTLHTLQDEQIEGMLSVNGSTGAVWYHDWHGPFVAMTELGGGASR